MLNTPIYITWDFEPALFHIGSRPIVWYGLLFAAGFLIGIQLMSRMFKWESKPEKHVDAITIYMIVATVVGARLGHCLFYQWETYKADPISILYIWEGGLASHGAAIGIITAIYLFSRRYKHPFLWSMDRVVIAVAIAGSLIRLGNLTNSEIIGRPTNAPQAFLFVSEPIRNVIQYVNQDDEIIDNIDYAISDETKEFDEITYPATELTITFKEVIQTEEVALQYTSMVWSYLERIPSDHNHFLVIRDDLNTDINPKLQATFTVYAIPRHPAQVYEAISLGLLFILLYFFIYLKRKGETPHGLLFGIFLTWAFGVRFFVEFIKENQSEMALNGDTEPLLNMGQILSIPLTLAGIFLIYRALKNTKKA